MRKMRLGLSLLVCLLAIGMLNRSVFAEERNIYIGDIITLEVKTKEMGEEEIRQAFEAFEVVEFLASKEGYIIKFRTFEPGEKEVVLGDQALHISVASTLDDLRREDIYEGEMAPRSGDYPLKWSLLYGAVLALFVISGCLYAISTFRKRQYKALTPYEKFVSALENIHPSTPSFLVDMTIIFKNFLEELLDTRIIGKTSQEMMLELEGLPQTSPHHPSIKNWLKVCDGYKFSGRSVEKEAGDQLLQELKVIGSVMSKMNEVER